MYSEVRILRNKDLEKYITDLENKKKRLEFELAEVEDELESVSKSICSTCNGTGKYWNFWAGNSPCPNCNRGY